MREAFRLLAKEGEMPEKTEWIFIGRRAIAGKKVADVMEDMRSCLASRLSRRKP